MTKFELLFDFTEEDVQQWKSNPVTKAILLALSKNLEYMQTSIVNYVGNDLIEFGRLQGQRIAYNDIVIGLEEPSFEELTELIKQQKEEENETAQI